VNDDDDDDSSSSSSNNNKTTTTTTTTTTDQLFMHEILKTDKILGISAAILSRNFFFLFAI